MYKWSYRPCYDICRVYRVMGTERIHSGLQWSAHMIRYVILSTHDCILYHSFCSDTDMCFLFIVKCRQCFTVRLRSIRTVLLPRFSLSVCLSVCLSNACIVTKRKHLAKKSSVMTNRKSPTSFPMSLRWTSYVAPKPPKGAWKATILSFPACQHESLRAWMS